MNEAEQTAKAVTLRPDPRQYARLKEYADQRRWSLNVAALALIDEALDARSQKEDNA